MATDLDQDSTPTAAGGTAPAERQWRRFLAYWAAGAAVAYLGLLVLFITVVVPAGGDSSLPEEFLELVAATREPVLYRLTIAFDVAAWVGLGGFLVAIAALTRSGAPVRSTAIAAAGMSAVIGFFGASLRLAGTSDLATRSETASPEQRTSVLQSYLDLQRQVDISFAAGGLLTSIALVLAASVVWRLPAIPHWASALLAAAGALGAAKGGTELATGIDLGPLSLLGAVLLIITYARIAMAFRHRPARAA